MGARSKFWRRSRVPKKGSRDEAFDISRGFAARDSSAVKSHSTILQRLRRQISLDYYTIPPATQAIHRAVHRSWPSLLKINFFLFNLVQGLVTLIAFLKLQLFSVWLRARIFVCIYIIKFVNDRLLCFSKLWAPGFS